VLDLYNGVGGHIVQDDDLTGSLDSEIATPLGTAAPRAGYSPIAALPDGNYQIRIRPFNAQTLGNNTWSMESRLFAGTVTFEAPQVPVGAVINEMYFDGLDFFIPQTMNIGPGDNLHLASALHMSRGAEIAMTGGSLNGDFFFLLSDASGDSTMRQSGGTSSYLTLRMATASGSIARYELSGNAVLTTLDIKMAMSPGASARFVQSGSSTVSLSELEIGSNSFVGAAAEYNLNGGVLSVAHIMIVGEGNIFGLAGGELRINSLANIVVTNVADFNWSHGTIRLQNDSPTEDTFALFGPTLTLTPGRVLLATFAQNFNSAIVLDGGKLSVPNLALGHPVQLKSGELNLTGAGGLTIGAGGPLGSNVTLPTGLTVSVTNATAVSSTAALLLNGGTFASGTLTNNGLIRGEGVVSAATTNAATGEIRAQAGMTLTFTGTNAANAGTINLQGGTAQFSQALTNGTNGQILGRGMLSVGGAGITNNGHIALSSGITDVFGDVSNNTASATRGISVSGNADVTFWDDVSNVGVSLFRVSAGSSATFFGTFSGTGISGPGDKYFEADVTPGASPAVANFGGNVSLGDQARLVIELGGITPGMQHDQLVVSGTLALGGSLDVSLIDGFSPVVGQEFNILDWGSLAGTFSVLNLPTLAGLTWNTSQLYSTGVLSVAATGLLGDYNQDGTVNAADYVVWRKASTLGLTDLPNDNDEPGNVGAAEFALWRVKFGMTAPGSGAAGYGHRDSGPGASTESLSAAVPEPATFVPLILAAAGALIKRNWGRGERCRMGDFALRMWRFEGPRS
jgi:hypothetical protein